MENMKDVIEKYTKIIRSLEQENQSLSAQFQSEQHFEKLYTDTVRENQQLSHSYSLLQ
jgi:predicted RNase H-like HicB family nuclease